jgi:hypothetical protein
MNGSFWPHRNGGNKRHNGGRRALWSAAALRPVVIRPVAIGTVVIGTVVIGTVALAACGRVAASGSGAGSGHASPPASAGSSGSPAATGGGAGSSPPALCRDAATLTRLEIVRNHGARVPELQPGFPSQFTVTDPARVRAVARALCGLPEMPRGLLHCPALLLGTAYTLHFTAAGRLLPLVTINSTGCEAVTGVGPVRRATSPGFWRVLAEAIGRKPPGPPVFGGENPGSACPPPSLHITKIDGCPGLARPGAGVA